MDTRKPSAFDEDIALLFLSKRDRALGLPRPGMKVASLLSYRRGKQRRALSSLVQGAFLRSVIDVCRDEALSLVKSGDDTPEIRERIGRLNEMAIQALELLNDA